MLKTIHSYHSKTLIFFSFFIMSALLPIFAAPARTAPALQYSSLIRLPLEINNTLFFDPVHDQWLEELKRAFYNPHSAEVILYINCVGGDGSASYAIYQLIKHLKQATGKPVYAFVDSFCASGGYLVACAADQIICHHDWSQVGSIGAVSILRNNFQAQKLVGVQTIQISSSDNKKDLSVMDPNSEVFKEMIKKQQENMMVLAGHFADAVIQARGAKLTITREELMKAEIYRTTAALQHGLVDGVMNGATFMRQYCRGLCAVESVYADNERHRVVSSFFMNTRKHLLARAKKHKLALLIHQQ